MSPDWETWIHATANLGPRPIIQKEFTITIQRGRMEREESVFHISLIATGESRRQGTQMMVEETLTALDMGKLGALE